MSAAITVVCPQCGNRMRASAEHIGRQGRCPSCRSLVEIQPAGDAASMASLHPESMAGPQPAGQSSLSATDIPAWLAGLIGAAATAILYLAVFIPLRGYAFGELFVGRGMIPYFTTLVTFWGLALLVLKYLAVKKQMSYAERELELIPLEVGLQITPVNVDQFLNHLAEQPAARRRSILGRRIQGALEHFKSRNSVPEVQQYLATQAEIDASQVDAGYTLLRAFIWAVPILGFIGTVMGISGAVSGLDATLADEASGQALMSGMKLVTGGLAEAFDTTLIALCMAVLLLFPTEALRKTEYGMLDRIEAFANESLLRRMSDSDKQLRYEDLPQTVRDVLEPAFQEHQRWLTQWQLQVRELGRVIGADFEKSAQNIQQHLVEEQNSRRQEAEDIGRLINELRDGIREGAEQWKAVQQSIASEVETFFNTAQRFQQALTENMLQYTEMLRQERQAMLEAGNGRNDSQDDPGPTAAVRPPSAQTGADDEQPP